jgi:hypothetical protein
MFEKIYNELRSDSEGLHLVNSIKGSFIMILLLSASFLSTSLGCKMQNLLKNNSILRHVLLICIIYFTISLSSPLSSSIPDPSLKLIKTFFVYILFLLFNTLNTNYTVFAISIFIILFITTNYKNYYEQTIQNKNQLKEIKENFNLFEILIITILIVSIILGFFFEVLKKRKNNDNFELLKYVLDISSCSQRKYK